MIKSILNYIERQENSSLKGCTYILISQKYFIIIIFWKKADSFIKKQNLSWLELRLIGVYG